MSDNNKEFGLSRRQVLGGLGIVGVASAGAGLGTTAYFSDEESFTDNTITAGQFELEVTQSIHMVDQDGGPDEVLFNNALEGEMDSVEGELNITDAKPGDSYKICWDPCVKHNPGYIQITLDAEESAGNDNGVDHVDSDGLLSEYMLAVVTVEGQDGVEGVVFAGTLGELIEAFEESGLIHATAEFDPETGEEVSAEYCHDPCESEIEEMATADAVEVCVYLYLPSGGDVGGDVDVGGVEFEIDSEMSPGNAVQGAQFSGDVHFEAEQCRHNENPFSSGEAEPVDDPVTTETA
ncbi:hypothetical protein GRS48_03340 [Halorubrum sp. JWXQ-INN 858]|uniref:SipW-dependent-type signal peptide-containing protein n=1 Tax=Halorubrum sp. JWXQ-INN 858 TaxID=2690782 RepID=UPI00135CBFED|nr:SipW-dependent-type signal peptide-containing protein [Halorubrum sp. JWXQ-INN 858]MWV63860.1 hypothetical protein [Halorubrum sp. JWXQ-INN 858]